VGHASEPVARPLRILEIGFQPLLSTAFPDQTEFIDTRFRWSEVRTYETAKSSLPRRLYRLAGSFVHLLRTCWRQEYDVVATRCLGPVNSHGRSILNHLGRVMMGGAFRGLVRFTARGQRVRLVVIDQTDHVTIHPRDHKFIRACALYFKRELADNHWHSLEAVLPRGACTGATRFTPEGVALRARLRPFALGIDATAIVPPIPTTGKKYDLFYVGTAAGIPLREGLHEVLDVLAGRGWRVFAPKERLTPDEYREAVRQSRLCLSPGGVGWDCYRHYEVVAFGSVPVFNYRGMQSIAPFRHGVHCFYYDPQGDVAEQVEVWLRLPPELLDRVAGGAQEHLAKHFTFDALAAYVLRELEAL